MKTVNLSKNKVNNLDKLDVHKDVMYNECELFSIYRNGKKYVVKKLKRRTGEYYANKLYTIEMLDSFRHYFTNNFILPDALISCGDKNIGFTYPYKEGVTLSVLLKDNSVDIRKKIDALKKVGELLKKMDDIRSCTSLKNLYLNDLHDSNFIVGTDGEIFAIDLDSVKIGDNKIFLSRYLNRIGLLSNCSKYIENNQVEIDETNISFEDFYYIYNLPQGEYIPDRNTDLYCYNIMIMNYLFGTSVASVDLDTFYNLLNLLDINNINDKLIGCFEKLILDTPNENPMNYLDILYPSDVEKVRSINLNKIL